MAQEQDKDRAQPVAWSYVPSKVFGDVVLTADPVRAEDARSAGCVVTPLYAAPQPNAALTDGDQLDLFAVALFLSSRHDPTCILKDENAERAIGLLLRLSGFELPAPPSLNASKEPSRPSHREPESGPACSSCFSTECNGECMENL